MNLGETIKLLRSEKGLTQPELAEKAQIEQSYLSKLENDKGTPSFDIINRIALALGLNGMELINRLSHSYIAERLGHIPEVAAEYASVRQRAHSAIKTRFLLALMLLVLGAGLISVGKSTVFFPEHLFEYESLGVIREGESIWQFDQGSNAHLDVDVEAAQQRMRNNISRVDVVFEHSYQNRGFNYVVSVPGGRRYFNFNAEMESERWQNALLVALGVMLLIAGALLIYVTERLNTLNLQIRKPKNEMK